MQIGEQLAHYRIVEKLGAGGMGEVYRARDDQLGRDVAIKVLLATNFDDQLARVRLVREARAVAALNHPNICTVHEVGEASGQAYIAMEFVEGMTLAVRLAAGALPPEQVVRYGVQLADALAHAHDRGVLHRDLKSANVIITPEGRVKVLDFGLAKKLTSSELTTQFDATFMRPGTIAGTVAYMAPEQLRGEPADASSDVWALGVVLYEMAQGARPFRGQTGFELSAATLNEPPAPLAPSVPIAIQAAIARCLQKDRAQRYSTAGEVRVALEMSQAVSDLPPTAPEVQLAAPRVRPRTAANWFTRRRVIWVTVATVLTTVSGLAAWRFWPSSAPSVLAVLPFQNALEDEGVDYLCDGVADQLILKIAGLSSIRVTAFDTALNFKGKDVDPQTAGRELRVQSVLAGTLTRQAGRLLVTAELVDVATGTTLWKNTFDRDAADVLSIEDEIAGAIIDEGLRLRLTVVERRQLVRHPTNDAEAYDLFLQAGHFLRRATEEDYLRARELLEQATVRDPKFADAYVYLAGVYASMVTDGYVRPTDAWPQVSRNMRQARVLDPDAPGIHVMRHAVAFFFDWDWAGAERERRLLTEPLTGEVGPSALGAFALERWALGQPQEALKLARLARELDPVSPGLAMLEADYLIHAGQFDAAVVVYERSLKIEPDSAYPHFGLAEARYRQGRFEEALAARRRAHELAGDIAAAEAFSKAHGEQGYRQADRVWVQQQLEDLKARAVANYVSPLDLARAYAQLGDRDRAFQYLDAAFADRAPGLVFLKVDRAWDSIRDDPRFPAAVRRVGLPDGPW